MKEQFLFGREHFEKTFNCGTYPLSIFRGAPDIYKLVDHGFIADSACVWGRDDFENHELVIISRTYCEDEIIDNPPAGLKCVRLPDILMGEEDHGTAIAIAIIENTPAANELLSMGVGYLPAHMLPYLLPIEMLSSYCISLVSRRGSDFPEAIITPITPPGLPVETVSCPPWWK